MNTAYLNGSYLDLNEAKVSVMDRGFLFGDGVYEVVPVYARTPFRFTEHLQRLANSLNSIGMANPHDDDAWRSIIAQVVATSPHADQQVYVQVTRGAAPVRNHAFPAVVTPTVLVMTEALLPPAPALLREGCSAVSAADIRWLRCNIKATSLLANCLLRQLAVDAGCAETILFRDDILTEGAASNIFVVKDGVLLAPPKNHLMLPGVTYDVVLEIAALHGLPHEVRDISADEVRHADELMLTSSTREVVPIVKLDDKLVADGKPGVVTLQLAAWYQDFKRELKEAAQTRNTS